MNWRDLDGPSLLRHFRDRREDGRNAWYVDKDEEKERTAPVQEADGHLRGCARLGKCHCPPNAPREAPAPSLCRLCGGTIGPSDTVSRGLMCYGCGPPEVIPEGRPEKKQRESEPHWGGEFP